MPEDNDDIMSVADTLSEIDGDVLDLAREVQRELGAEPSQQPLGTCVAPLRSSGATRTTGSCPESRRGTQKSGKKRTTSKTGEKEVKYLSFYHFTKF